MREFFKKHWFWITVSLLVLIKQRLVTFLPLFPIYTAGIYDDLLMARIADVLLQGNWPNQAVLLTKGIGFPLFLIIGIFSGIGYGALTSLFHSAASLLMTLATRPLFSKKWILLIYFTVLLFMPAAFTVETYQRVYRNSITIWQVLLILASLFGMLLRLNEPAKRLLWWSIPGIIGLTWLYHTREDAVWCVLFAFGMLVVSLIFLISVFPIKSKLFFVHGIILSLPLIVLFFSIEIISALNWHYNGFWGTTLFTSGSFSQMVKTIYSISWPDSAKLPPRLAISRKQIKDLYNYSDTLKKNREQIEKQLDISARPGKNGEVENGWIFWSMMNWTGQNPKKSKIFYQQVTAELKTAIANGKLKTRKTMPSALMAPWKPSASKFFIMAFQKSWKLILTEKELYLYDGFSSEQLHGVRYLEDFTRTKFRHVSDERSKIVDYQNFAVSVLRKVIFIYNKTAVLLNILGIFGFFLMLISFFINKDANLLKTLFFLAGAAASCTVLILGIAYTDATGFTAVVPAYLAGGYPIVLVFNLTAFFAAWNILAEVLPAWFNGISWKRKGAN